MRATERADAEEKKIGFVTLQDRWIVRVVCPNFGLNFVIPVFALINHNSKTETISKLAVHSQLLQNHFSPAKMLYFVNEEVRAHNPIPEISNFHRPLPFCYHES